MGDLLELAARVDRCRMADNTLDVLVELALFEPHGQFISARANAAVSKVIYRLRNGSEVTHWADDWTAVSHKAHTVSALRARAALAPSPNPAPGEQRHD